MLRPNLSKKVTSHQRQENFMAWSLTILLHLLLVAIGIYWYIQQKTPAPVANTLTATNPIIVPVSMSSSSPEPTPVQAQIDDSVTPSVTPATPTTAAQPITKSTPQLNHTLPPTTSNTSKITTLQKSVTRKTTAENQIKLNTPLHSDKEEFPVNGSTITQTDIKTTPTAYGSITTTTTNRITTVAPEINQALTSRDISAKEQRVMSEQTGKHLSNGAKQANQLAKDLEKTNDATTQLIETVKRKNQASIDNDHTPIEK